MNRLQHKLGPLKLWQWIAIGAALGVAVLVYKKTHPNAEGEEAATGELFGGTGTGAYGAIDPNTGVPYQFEGGAGGAAGEGSAAGEIANWIQTLKELGIWPEGGEAGTPEAGEAGPAGEAPAAELLAHKNAQKKKAKTAKAKAGGATKHPATSTGAGVAAGGNSHTAAPHPAQRTAVAAAAVAAPAPPGTGPAPAGPGSASGGVIHPAAVSMGISVKQPKPNAPPGWHIYAGANGQWWRAPNS